MDSNTHSTGQPPKAPTRSPDGLAALTAAVQQLAAQDLSGLPDAVRAERVLELRRLLDRLEGHWLKELAGVDAPGGGRGRTRHPGRLHRRLAAGPAAPGGRRRPRVCPGRPGPVPRPVGCDGPGVDRPAGSTRPCRGPGRRHPRPGPPGRGRGRTGAGGGGPPPGPSPPAPGGRPSAPGARPDPTAAQAERRHGRRGLWLTATWEGMVAVDGRLEPEAGQSLLAALEPLARPAPPMRVVGTSVGPTPWPSWPAAASKAGGWPAT